MICPTRRYHLYCLKLLLVFSWLLTAVQASANQRLALVVGIDNYDNVSALQKANNDAHAVSETLQGVGFNVTKLIDADRRTLNRAISSVTAKINPGDEVVFYFAGHGIEVDARNYLLPADVPAAKPGDEEFIVSESIAADRVLSAFRRQGARVTLLILDACRNNPFPADGQRSLGGTRGLARMDPPEGSFILFSAGTGQTALDRLSNADPDPNSVFTRALLPRLRQRGLPILDLVQVVRTDVRTMAASVNHNQFPAYYDQLDQRSGKFSFNPGDPSAVEPAAGQKPQSTSNAVPLVVDSCQTARADWQVLSKTQSRSALSAFARKYADCPIYVAAAEDRIKVLDAGAAATAVKPVIPKVSNGQTGGDLCARLWYERNLIFHNRGYCFRTARARAVFDISNCTTRNPRLTAAENRRVARIKAAEKANGC